MLIKYRAPVSMAVLVDRDSYYYDGLLLAIKRPPETVLDGNEFRN